MVLSHAVPAHGRAARRRFGTGLSRRRQTICGASSIAVTTAAGSMIWAASGDRLPAVPGGAAMTTLTTDLVPSYLDVTRLAVGSFLARYRDPGLTAYTQGLKAYRLVPAVRPGDVAGYPRRARDVRAPPRRSRVRRGDRGPPVRHRGDLLQVRRHRRRHSGRLTTTAPGVETNATGTTAPCRCRLTRRRAGSGHRPGDGLRHGIPQVWRVSSPCSCRPCPGPT